MGNQARISARVIGERIGATAEEVNYLLKDQGFLYGEPGAYGLTPKGQAFGVHRDHDNGYGGFAHRAWETTHFAPGITEVLETAPERLTKVRKEILARRQAQQAARKAAQSALDAQFQAFQARKDAPGDRFELNPENEWLVIVGLGVIAGAGYGAYKGVQWCRRKMAARTDPGESK